jgi:hypothetical protein
MKMLGSEFKDRLIIQNLPKKLFIKDSNQIPIV